MTGRRGRLMRTNARRERAVSSSGPRAGRASLSSGGAAGHAAVRASRYAAARCALILAVGLWFTGAVVATAHAGSGPSTTRSTTPSTIDLPETPAQLVLDASWSAIEPVPSLEAAGVGAEQLGPARIVTAFRHPAQRRPRQAGADLALVVLRFDSPNPLAWRTSTREAYFDRVEEDLLAACSDRDAAGSPMGRPTGSPTKTCRGLRRTKRKELTAAGVPALELQAKDRDGKTLLLRLLFFRTYTILAAAELPPRSRDGARVRKALASFAPPASWQR